MSTARPVQRLIQNSNRRPTYIHAQFRQRVSRRWQATDATAAAATEATQSAFTRFWNSNVGPKTVHFWAPVMKWGVVLAGVADFARPAEKLSLQQNGALVATGLIWTRWCLIIKPRNLLLASVNFLLGCVGIVQVSRILAWQSSQKNKTTSDLIVDKARDVKDGAVDAAKDGAEKVKATVQ